MPTVSDVSIANTALTMLSTSRISDLTDNLENARKVNAIYDMSRNEILSEHNWNFARKQATLSLLSETPPVGNYSYVYQLPSDAIRVIRMKNDTNFAIYGKKLYTNSDTANIEYICEVTDSGQFSAHFAKALASKLAMELAYGITQSSTQTQLMSANYTRVLKEAKWADAQEGVGVPMQTGSFITSRGN